VIFDILPLKFGLVDCVWDSIIICKIYETNVSACYSARIIRLSICTFLRHQFIEIFSGTWAKIDSFCQPPTCWVDLSIRKLLTLSQIPFQSWLFAPQTAQPKQRFQWRRSIREISDVGEIQLFSHIRSDLLEALQKGNQVRETNDRTDRADFSGKINDIRARPLQDIWRTVKQIWIYNIRSRREKHCSARTRPSCDIAWSGAFSGISFPDST
jgi:hypothetical protein